MPYKTTWEPNGVYQCFYGELTRADREKSNNEVMETPKFSKIKYWIINSLDIDEYSLVEKDAIAAAATDIGAAYTNNNISMAFVTKNKEHKKNIIRFISVLKHGGSPWKAKLFDDMASAREWISST